jgi:hypothetical protein
MLDGVQATEAGAKDDDTAHRGEPIQ